MNRLMVIMLALPLIGCMTTNAEPAVVHEYHEIRPDYSDAKVALFAARPDVVPDLRDVHTMEDAAYNSVQFQTGMDQWIFYAVSLEDWIKKL